VHYWADLQSVHGFRCCDNMREREMSASACTRSVPGLMYVYPSAYGDTPLGGVPFTRQEKCE